MIFRFFIRSQPKDYPYHTQAECNKKGITPVCPIIHHKQRKHKGNNGSSYIGTCIENTGSQSSFFLGKPFCYCLNARREISGFSNSQSKARNRKSNPTQCFGYCSMQYTKNSPYRNGKGVSFLRTQLIYKSPHHQLTDGVSNHKRDGNISVLGIRPMEDIIFQGGCKESDNTAIHVVNGGRHK